MKNNLVKNNMTIIYDPYKMLGKDLDTSVSPYFDPGCIYSVHYESEWSFFLKDKFGELRSIPKSEYIIEVTKWREMVIDDILK